MEKIAAKLESRAQEASNAGARTLTTCMAINVVLHNTMVPLAGLEPALAAYLALTGYKSAALPIELQGRDRCDHADIR